MKLKTFDNENKANSNDSESINNNKNIKNQL